MIMAGYEFVGKKPFGNVYFTGIVRDKIGRKMSKSLGNSPDPLELIDKFGADGVRMGIMLAAPAGHDIMYDDSLCEQGRNFCNKIWNSFRLVKGWQVADIEQPESSRLAVEWFDERLKATVAETDDLMGKFRISEALMEVYRLFWDEFSAWLLEVVKPAYGQPIDRATYDAVIRFFDMLLRLLHPFMPFITEELWQHLNERAEGESIMLAQLPAVHEADKKMLEDFEHLKEVVAGIRTVRKQKQIKQVEQLVLNAGPGHDSRLDAIITKMGNISAINNVAEKDPTAAAFIVGKVEYSIPLADKVNVEEEIAKLEKDLDYYTKFLNGVEKKLSNERFVANAPEAVVAMERKKKADAEAKLATIRTSLAALK